jgi:hypothetical protein
MQVGMAAIAVMPATELPHIKMAKRCFIFMFDFPLVNG